MGVSLPLHVVILAAGQGTRMRSDTPKILHCLAGKPLLDWVIDAATALHPAQIHVIYGHEGEKLRQSCTTPGINWVYQAEQNGTGHAVQQALPHLPDDSLVLVLAADVPLITDATLQSLLALHSTPLTLLTTVVNDPTGYGRILRDTTITGIVEEKDASAKARKIQEIYTGICVVNASHLKTWLPKLKTQNAQHEYYLTDIVRLACEEGLSVQAYITQHPMEAQGVNTRLQLVTLERYWQVQQAHTLLLQGVGIVDPHRIDIRGSLAAGRDVLIDINTLFEGSVTLGDGCHIGPNCILKNVTLGQRTHILANSVLEDTHIGNDCTIGPFARLRPGTHLQDACKIGNFVETKNAHLDNNSKASHLTYLGDVTIGKNVNIGAGTITCNYDGAHKNKTLIEDDVFIGSGTELVAPITIARGATIGAGTTLRDNAPAHSLTLTPNKQKSIADWRRPQKE